MFGCRWDVQVDGAGRGGVLLCLLVCYLAWRLQSATQLPSFVLQSLMLPPSDPMSDLALHWESHSQVQYSSKPIILPLRSASIVQGKCRIVWGKQGKGKEEVLTFVHAAVTKTTPTQNKPPSQPPCRPELEWGRCRLLLRQHLSHRRPRSTSHHVQTSQTAIILIR